MQCTWRRRRRERKNCDKQLLRKQMSTRMTSTAGERSHVITTKLPIEKRKRCGYIVCCCFALSHSFYFFFYKFAKWFKQLIDFTEVIKSNKMSQLMFQSLLHEQTCDGWGWCSHSDNSFLALKTHDPSSAENVIRPYLTLRLNRFLSCYAKIDVHIHS